jgi:predicted phosphoribosyltransferase
MRFGNRADAGRALAERLRAYAGRSDVVVLALPRGGVVVGFELARELAVALDIYLVRKLGVPGHEELAMGAIASDGTRVLNTTIVAHLGITDEAIARTALEEGRELERRERAYRQGRAAIDVRGRTVILVDDGLATGASMRVAALALRTRGPERLVIAVPVASRDVCDELRKLVDELVCLEANDSFRAVGAAYDDFSQTSDDEVRELLARASGSGSSTARAGAHEP